MYTDDTRVNSQLKENWSVIGMDLIGPLKETAKNKTKNQYILKMTDLLSKFVAAEPLQSKFYIFSMVSRVISVLGREFVNEV